MGKNLPSSLPPVDISQPQPSEVEVSIFGSHVGECVVVHLSNGKWIIVDSCRHPSNKKPVALVYLENLGVNVACDVELIVISHWHDDHIQGVSDLVRVCHSARVCFPLAMLKDEFLTLLSIYSDDNSLVDRYSSGTREMADTVKILADAPKPKSVVKIGADRILIDEPDCLVRSLSPSDKAYNDAIACFASLIPSVKSDRKTIPSPERNDTSVVLWISCHNQIILLGSDLEETADGATGWKAIVDSPVRPKGKACLFKIPHHGSVTGHSDDVWEHMVAVDAICLLTEHTRGKYSIPTDNDIERIKQKTSKLFCTSLPRHKLVKRDGTVERTLRGMVKDRKILGRDIGQVQVRLPASGAMRVGAESSAMAL